MAQRDFSHPIVFKKFEENARKLFPNRKSMYQVTKELNEVLEEMLYGKKRKRH